VSGRRWGRASQLPRRVPPGAQVVQARGLGIDLGGRRVLDGVDLEVSAGELVALVGPNGAGKSTLMAALVGDVTPAVGTVEVDGRAPTAWSHVELAMRRAVLPQQVAVSFPFEVRDVVRMGRSPWLGTEREADDDQAIRSALRQADVLQLSRRRVPTLSGGERARVALARVLAQDTQLLMLDEPTAALDVHHQELVFEVARSRVERGDAVVTVVHDLGLAAAHADRVALLAEGRLVAVGPPAEVLRPEPLSEVYRHDIEVIAHPVTGDLLVLPRRRLAGADAGT
jgi:iron complex transport system ATP-binding protein